MIFKHKTTDIQETNNKKFLNDDEKNIVQNIKRYNSSNHSFTKSIQLRDTKKLTVPRINIEGECYQNLLDMGTGISYMTYSLASGEVEEVYKNRDFIMIKNKTRTNSILLWINVGNILDIIKPSTKYTLVLDFYGEKDISAISTRIMGHDMQNINSSQTNTQVNKKTGRLFIPITTLSTIDKTNPQMACIYMQAHIVNLTEGDRFYFGNARLFQGTITEEQYKSNGRITGITGVGDKSRNLFNPKLAKRKTINVDTGVIYRDDEAYIISDYIPVNGGEQYVLYDELYDYANSRYILEYDVDKNFIQSTRIEYGKYGNRKRITLNSNTAYVIVRFWSADIVNGLGVIGSEFTPYKNIMFRKDDNETCVFEPYYEGYKISLHSNNSNIFDPNNLVVGNIRGYDGYAYAKNFDKLQGDIIPDYSYNMVCSKNLIRVKPNTTYKVRRGVDYNGLNILVEKIVFYDENGRSACGSVDNYSQKNVNSSNFDFTTHNNVISMRLVFKTSTNQTITPSDVMNCGFTISELDTVETNNGDSCDIYLDEPLLKLPDGTKDEIKDGYLIRRVGKIVFDGDEKFDNVGYVHNELSLRFDYFFNDSASLQKDLVCNNMIVYFDGCDNPKTENFYIAGHAAQGRIVIIFPKSKLSSHDIEGFKQWLSVNPTTVFYKRKTPIVTKLNMPGISTFDNYTEIYTDTNLSSPKQFTLPGNLNSRISTNKDRLFSLKERISKLERISLTSVLNTIDIKDGEHVEKV